MNHLGDGKMGEGTLGGPASGATIPLRIKGRTNLVLTLEWDKIPNIGQYLLFRNGAVVSNTFESDKTSWRTSYHPGDRFDVVAYQKVAGGGIVV